MKKSRKIIALIVGVLMIAALAITVAACKPSKIEVGISMPTRDLQRWNQDGEYLQNEFKKAGYKAAVTFANNDIPTQQSQIESLISRGAKVIYIAAINATSLGEVCQKAHEAGVTIIGHDRILENTDYIDYYATFDNTKVGASCAQFIVDKLDLDNAEGPFNIEMVGGDPDDANAGYVYNGGMDILQPYIDDGKLVVKSGHDTFEEVATPEWSARTAQDYFETVYSTNYSDTKLDAVFCSNDSTAQGVAAALDSALVSIDDFPIITGQDCDIPSVQNMIVGKQSMSVFKDTRTLATENFKIGLAVLKGEDVVTDTTQDNGKKEVPTVVCDVTICIKVAGKVGDVDCIGYQELIDSGYYTKKDLGLE